MHNFFYKMSAPKKERTSKQKESTLQTKLYEKNISEREERIKLFQKYLLKSYSSARLSS